jgi:hypothetical protein
VDRPILHEPVRLKLAVSFVWKRGDTSAAVVLRAIAQQMSTGYKDATFSQTETADHAAAGYLVYSDRVPNIRISLGASCDGDHRWVLILGPSEHPGARGVSFLLSDALEECDAAECRWYDDPTKVGAADEWASLPI